MTDQPKSSDQVRFLDTIRAALGRADAPPVDFQSVIDNDLEKTYKDALAAIANRTVDQKNELLKNLEQAAQPLNLKVKPVKDFQTAAASIAELVQSKQPEWGTHKQVVAWQHPLVDKLDLTALLAEHNIPVVFTEQLSKAATAEKIEKHRRQVRQSCEDAFIGVTAADFCVAETATLVMKTRPGCARSVSLVPSIHVAVIKLSQIVSNLKELYAHLKWDSAHKAEGLTNCMTFISGPSKTADIEFVMVHGAHGPREVYIYVITD